MNYISIFIVVVLILAISHQAQSDTVLINFFEKLEELAHKAAQMGIKAAKTTANAITNHGK
ncbi:andropin [Drosophila takahashii]|uniref:andropin n=1 Tax=Drosophila takahashii TaxID=29030 RepID=UPI0038993028